VAHYLRNLGFNAFVVHGGFTAWRRAGFETEPVPATDRVLLPKFT
jgi:rhodanese-related sulfurtransferase